MPRSADLAGRSVKLSADVPAMFDAPLAPHHKLIGRWAAGCEKSARRYTRPEARRRIERQFDAAVAEILKPIDIADLRVVVLMGDDQQPPAIAVVCDSVGQIDLGWIERDNVLRETIVSQVAPMRWQAAAYKAIEQLLGFVLPLFGYDELFEMMSMYQWDGATTDDEAIRSLVDYQGYELEDIDEEMLPSAMNARRPKWMIASNAAPLKELPAGLRDRIRRLRLTHKAVKDLDPDYGAWRFDSDVFHAYFPDDDYRSDVPPMTLVPAEHFARELDYVGQQGMESAFMDIAGICPLFDASKVDDWFTSLKVGADLLLAAQDLINFDPANPEATNA